MQHESGFIDLTAVLLSEMICLLHLSTALKVMLLVVHARMLRRVLLKFVQLRARFFGGSEDVSFEEPGHSLSQLEIHVCSHRHCEYVV